MFFCSECVRKVPTPEDDRLPHCPQCRKILATQTPIIARNGFMVDEQRTLSSNEIFVSNDVLMMGSAALGGAVWGRVLWEITLPSKAGGDKYYARHVKCPIDLAAQHREKSVIVDPVLDEGTTVVILPKGEMLQGTPLQGARADGKLLLRLLTNEADLRVARAAMSGGEGTSQPKASDISLAFAILHDGTLPANACRVSKGVALSLGKYCRVQARAGKGKVTSIVSVVHAITSPQRADTDASFIYLNLNSHNNLLTGISETTPLTATVTPIVGVPQATHIVLKAAFVHFNLSTSWPEGKVSPYHDVMEMTIKAILMDINEMSNAHATILSVGTRIDDGIGRVSTAPLIRQINGEAKYSSKSSHQIQRDISAVRMAFSNVLAFVHVAEILDDTGESVPNAILHSAGERDASVAIEGFGRASTPTNSFITHLEVEGNKASFHGVIQMAEVQEFSGLGAGPKTPMLPFLISFEPRPPPSRLLKLKATPSGCSHSRLVAVIERNSSQVPLVLNLNDSANEELEVGTFEDCKTITVVTNDPDALIYAEVYDHEDFEGIVNGDEFTPEANEDIVYDTQGVENYDEPTHPLENVRRLGAPPARKPYQPVPGSSEPVASIDVFPNGLLLHLTDGSQLSFKPSGIETDEILSRVLSGQHPFLDCKVGDEVFEVRLKYSTKDYEASKTPNFGPAPGRILGMLRAK